VKRSFGVMTDRCYNRLVMTILLRMAFRMLFLKFRVDAAFVDRDADGIRGVATNVGFHARA